ncbi:MAG TPA: DNA repair protein RecN [Ignavibacteria bacterium]|nr:DNA repair protein RecN [Ignavibacteria bacterium]HQY51667.1 DNA repair protein RecN [Ignavibacteria bacterium]HRA99139.1 DNA repair protein RecN [Ignavibacteria bacterium]
MIEKLLIKNYLIIKEAEIHFSEGLNILTGETGAGKSIILDALSLLLGERADHSKIKSGDDKLIMEGQFNFTDNKIVENLYKEMFPEDEFNGYLILRREINTKGINRSFINDTPVNISDMKKFGDVVIDIHSQNEHQSLLSKETHIGILDNYVSDETIFSEYEKGYLDLRKSVSDYKEFISKKEDLLSRKKFLDHDLKEINNVNIQPGEDEEIETELDRLENSEEISSSLSISLEGLSENDFNALNIISAAVKELKKISDYDKNFEKLIEDLESSYILIKETSSSLLNYNNDLNFDPVRIEHLRSRLLAINSLKRKHELDIPELLEKAENIQKDLTFAENFDHEIDKLDKKISVMKSELFSLAEKISDKRIKRAKDLEKEINKLLKEVGLESAEFKVDIKKNISDSENEFTVKKGKENYELSQNGINNIEFLIRTNKGMELSPLRKSASGGEISRIMLAIKTVLSENDNIGILVFDEIDAGISGRIAQKVGNTLKKLAVSHQIICITHLPQIAANSDRHFNVSKSDENNETKAYINILDDNEKINEVAKLLSGEKITESTINSAKELISGK